jgi:DNA-binding response OmpR family regulator
MAKEILAVGDDRSLVKTIRIVFQSNGYQVSIANKPQTGFSKTHTDRPNLNIACVGESVRGSAWTDTPRIES